MLPAGGSRRRGSSMGTIQPFSTLNISTTFLAAEQRRTKKRVMVDVIVYATFRNWGYPTPYLESFPIQLCQPATVFARSVHLQ